MTDFPWRLMVLRNRSAVEQSVTRLSRSEAAPWSLAAEGRRPVEAVGYPRPNELSSQVFGAKAAEVRNGISFIECASLETANFETLWRKSLVRDESVASPSAELRLLLIQFAQGGRSRCWNPRPTNDISDLVL